MSLPRITNSHRSTHMTGVLDHSGPQGEPGRQLRGKSSRTALGADPIGLQDDSAVYSKTPVLNESTKFDERAASQRPAADF